MVRGLERRPIFRNDVDRADFVRRLAALVDATGLTVYAWALLPNHAHLLIQTGQRSLARCMRALLTGYAGAFNRRHKRVGHLFQNRYKSIVVEAEPYLLELVRYLHLNPLRAQVVPTLGVLDRYPWAGHSALLGFRPCAWQATGAVLQQFGPTPARARKAYRAFVVDGIPHGRRPELQGGGLLRSLGGWRAVASLRRGREAYGGDERVLGSAEFVEAVRRTLQAAEPVPGRRRPLAELVAAACAATECSPTALRQGSRRARAARAREGVAYLALEVCGYPGSAVADLLGVRPSAVYRAAQRGCGTRERWEKLLSAGETIKNIRKQRPV
ncbi:MAG: transposase [candidate division NC10 bacterium]